MAKNNVGQWDTTPANNTDVGGISIEGTAPVSNFDGALRTIMAQIKDGTGVPADLLDGQHGTYYRNAGNLNAGTVPADRLAGGSYSFSALKIEGAIPRIDLLDSDAADFYIRVDSGVFSVLTDRDSSGTWETPHPLQLDNSSGEGTLYGDKIWTAGNDGAGSGLAADTVDGVHLSGLVQTSRTITAGNGLTGLGDMSADRSVAVGAGTGITVGTSTVSVDTTVWRDGNLPTAAQIGGIIAGLTQGAIGSYATVIKKTAGTINPGSTVAGTDLYWSNSDDSAAIGIDVGTWRAVGVITNTASATALRIS
ncbi:hypothetical protein [Allorhizobium borbori]|uniref:Uncharacterized protein n=1 Tax=Allorhizobium borbori TaxID=485907 RepID=A0A7W6P1A2_9HYPH|nr:hypothetical protein [Allorhizobium borbori]MBB4103582.1 hypothetical protein [Allorhizobium borbori]